MADRSVGSTFLTPFLEGMSALGYESGRNYDFYERWGNNSREALERAAVEATALKPSVFVSQGPALQVVRDVAGTTPVVFGNSGDPMDTGVAQSIARPGGRFTGITFLSYALVGKRVEVLHELLPGAKRLAVLSNPDHGGDAKELAETRQAAARLGIEASHHPATNVSELAQALIGAAAARAEALIVHPDALMVQERATIARFALEHRLPAISAWEAMAEAGAMLTYGPVLKEGYRRLAYFVDRILRGAKPGDIPIEFPSKVELIVNLKTARALGLTVPQSLLVRADRVIE